MPQSLSDPMLLGLSAALLMLASFAFVLATLVERSSTIRLRHWSEEAGGGLRRLYEDRRGFAAFRLLLNLFAWAALLALVPVLGALFAGALRFPQMLAVVTVLLFAALLEGLYSRVLDRYPEPSLDRLTPFYRLAHRLAQPGILLLRWMIPDDGEESKQHGDDEDEASDEELQAFIDVGTEEGILDDRDTEWVRSVVNFGDTWVRSVMTPRIDMVCAPLERSLEELEETFIDSTHSRIPLYKDSVDEIVGILHLRDLVRAQRQDPRPAVEEILQPVLHVPEGLMLHEVLRDLQDGRQQMAIVVDEYGGTSGLVTIEDLLEEIVGEIVDMDEDPPPRIEALEGGGGRVDGRVHLEDLEKAFGIDLQAADEPYETLGGLIFNRLGYVPEENQVVDVEGMRFVVERVEGKRIQTVRVERTAEVSTSELARGAG
ncbi:MAG: hemolysin family protein [Acidobacteriota bacterium]